MTAFNNVWTELKRGDKARGEGLAITRVQISESASIWTSWTRRSSRAALPQLSLESASPAVATTAHGTEA